MAKIVLSKLIDTFGMQTKLTPGALAAPLTKSQRKNLRKKMRKLAVSATRLDTRVQPTYALRPAQATGMRRAVKAVTTALGSQTSALARQMALPDDSPNWLRLPTADMPRTAVLRTTDTVSVTQLVSPAMPTWAPCKSTEVVVIAYGQPGRSFMYGPVTHTIAQNGTTSTFAFNSNPASGGGDSQSVITPNFQIIPSGEKMAPGSSRVLHFNPVRHQDTPATPGPPLRPLGRSKGRTYFYVDSTEKLLFANWYNGSNVTVPGPQTVNIYYWVGPMEEPELEKTLTWDKAEAGSNLFSYATSYCGYYAIEVIVGALDSDTLNAPWHLVVSTTAVNTNPTRYINTYVSTITQAEVGESCRRTGYSLLITNTSAQINQQGTVIAARMVNEVVNAATTINAGRVINTTTLNNLASKYKGKAANGLYTYMDFEIGSEQFEESCNDYANPTFNLDYLGFVHVVAFNNPNAATAVQSYLFTSCMIYEARVDNQLFEVSAPALEYNALVEARRINNSTDYFYENPLHMSDIWDFIKKSVSTVRRAALPIGAAISALAPEAAPIVMPMARALQS